MQNSTIAPSTIPPEEIKRLFSAQLQTIQANADRAFAYLCIAQWVFCVICALTVSPQSWQGYESEVHPHVWGSVFVGGAIAALPAFLARFAAGAKTTRWVVAGSQAMMSALIIHVLGGRIEAHFHIFGVLAFLSFYRDKSVYIPMVGLVVVDHLARGLLFPESIYGLSSPALMRSLEHGAWVVYETAFLIWGIGRNRQSLYDSCKLQLLVEKQRDGLEDEVARQTCELEAAKQRAQTLVEAIDRVQGRIEFAPSGEILDANQNLADMFGYTVEELIGVHHRAVVSDEIANSEEYKQFWDLLRAGEFHSGEFERVAKDGSERWIYGTYSPIRDDQGNICRIVKYAIDHTERRMLEDQLGRAQKLESIGQLAAGIAHEINTPMQYVNDNIEFLSEWSDKLFMVVDNYRAMLDDNDSPKSWLERKQEMEELTESCLFDRIRLQVPAAIEESREGVKRTVDIVRAMKDFSHPGARERKSACLNDLIQSTVAISRNRWKYAAEMQLELDPDLPLVPMFTSEINQVLLNLIVNAGDAIAEKNEGADDALGNITVRSGADENWVIVEVEDDGCGIPEAIQQKIFDPFFTTKDPGKGTGQGLSITHNVVVLQHAGVIEIDSSPGAGTKFTVKLPRNPEVLDAASSETPAENEQQAESETLFG